MTFKTSHTICDTNINSYKLEVSYIGSDSYIFWLNGAVYIYFTSNSLSLHILLEPYIYDSSKKTILVINHF